jgi:hypothetical protein
LSESGVYGEGQHSGEHAERGRRGLWPVKSRKADVGGFSTIGPNCFGQPLINLRRYARIPRSCRESIIRGTTIFLGKGPPYALTDRIVVWNIDKLLRKQGGDAGGE